MEVMSQIGAGIYIPPESASHIQTDEKETIESAFSYREVVPEIDIEETEAARFSEEYRKQVRKSRPLSKSLEGRIASGTTSNTDNKNNVSSFESDPLAVAAKNRDSGRTGSLASDTKNVPK